MTGQNKKNTVSICVPAFNEEKNIGKILEALINQITNKVFINKIVVVSSASTDNTDNIVKDFCKKDSRVQLIQQKTREGKAAAINAFLKLINDEIVVIESADTIPQPNTIEHLCLPLLNDKSIGMTGGAPIPVNDPKTFLGYIIHTWWWFHRNIPRFGEIIAYRNIIKALSTTTAVDEAYIQAKMIQLSFKAVHVDEAVVFNKGAEHIRDLIKQRRRVFNGHARLYQKENIKIDNMTKSTLYLLLFKFPINSFKELLWIFGGIMLEGYAYMLGMYDMKISKKNPFIWDTAGSTKNLKRKQAYDFIS
jgi:cellulose synthase/poly-beta-1,6-N-acetylglucosamine synthase-like glycosyltransferase